MDQVLGLFEKKRKKKEKEKKEKKEKKKKKEKFWCEQGIQLRFDVARVGCMVAAVLQHRASFT